QFSLGETVMRRVVTVWAWIALVVAAPAVTQARAQAQPGLKIAFISSQQILEQTPGYAAAESTFKKEYQGVCSRICCELMNAILSPGCACARAWVAAGVAARKPIHAHTVTTRLMTISLREELLVQ